MHRVDICYGLCRVFTLLFCATILSLLAACGDGAGDEADMQYRVRPSSWDESIYSLIEKEPYSHTYNRALLSHYNDSRLMDSVIFRSRQLLEYARETGDSRLEDIAATYLYHAYLNESQTDSLSALQGYVDRICIEDTTTFIGLLANNIAAINAINTSLDYPMALDHFNRGYRIAESHSDTVNMAVFLSNISYIYLIREDSSGLESAYKAYDLGVKSGQVHIRINAMINLADLLLLENDFAGSLRYSQEAMELTGQSSMYNYMSNVSVIMACALHGQGRMEEAGEEFARARKYLGEADPEVRARYYLEYGKFLSAKGEYSLSLTSFISGLETRGCSPEKKRQILLNMSQTYSECGSDADALRCYKEYHTLSDSLSVSRKEKDFNLLRMKYEQVEYEQRITRNELTIERNNRIIIMAVSALLLIAVVAVFIYVLYLKQNQMYRQIVEQHQQHLERERKLREEHKMKQEGADDRKERELYSRIEDLMTTHRIYRQKDISLDRLAEMLESNRSYVSKVINRFSGMNFISYVNYKRIEEATGILSDSNDDTPLKKLADDLGFNSISTFYRVFQKEVGCPPSRYREEICRLRQ